MSLSTNPKQPSLDIVFEDESLIVINKPSGVVVNISDTTPSGTIQDEIHRVYGEDLGGKAEVGSEFYNRAGIVHRLDKDTSGVMLVAKDEDSFLNLKNQFKDRVIEKEYQAVALGEMSDPIIEVDAPIARNPEHRTRMAIVDKGRKAETRFEAQEVVDFGDEKLSIVRCYPKTGRTHQIRVHLAALKNPVIADPIYMTRKQFEQFEPSFDRLMLHAFKIRFNHPKTNKELFYEAPLPKVFTEICSKSH